MNWTESELQFLREKRGSMTMGQIAQALGRRKWEVKDIVSKLGIPKLTAHIRWTPDEVQMLKQLYPLMTVKEIALAINRTPDGVAQKAKELRLSAGQRYTAAPLPIGTERMDPSRGLIRKVKDSGPKLLQWVRVEVIEWEKVNGPVPAGHMLMRKNLNLPRSLDNLALITPEEHVRRISVHQMPENLQELYRIKSQITKAVKRLSEEKTPAP